MYNLRKLTSILKSWRNIALFSIIITLSSCDWIGSYISCIEADDFGEFEYITITVPARGGSFSCEFDVNSDKTLAEQGITAGNPLYDCI